MVCLLLRASKQVKKRGPACSGGRKTTGSEEIDGGGTVTVWKQKPETTAMPHQDSSINIVAEQQKRQQRSAEQTVGHFSAHCHILERKCLSIKRYSPFFTCRGSSFYLRYVRVLFLIILHLPKQQFWQMSLQRVDYLVICASDLWLLSAFPSRLCKPRRRAVMTFWTCLKNWSESYMRIFYQKLTVWRYRKFNLFCSHESKC